MKRNRKGIQNRRIGRKAYPFIVLFILLVLLSGKEAASSGRTEHEQEQTAHALQNRNAGITGHTGNPELEAGLQVHFLDVGQADATLILCGSHAMLIDAGGDDVGTAVQLYLQKQGVDSLDYMIGTHPDWDHIGGMDVIVTKFDCGTVMMPDYPRQTAAYRNVTDAMEYRHYRNTLPKSGDTYPLGEASFTIIAPNHYDYGEVVNNYSIGLKLTYGETSFVFTGDAHQEAEKDILANGIDLNGDVLKAGHHGSSTSTTDDLVRAVSPAYSVISCGAENEYGLPHQETLNTLQNHNVFMFRTDLQGTIVAYSDGHSISWSCEPFQ